MKTSNTNMISNQIATERLMNDLSPGFVRDVLGETNDPFEDLDLKAKVNIV